MRIGELTGNEIPPIDEFIVKISSRCNIDCDYCYEYNLGDASWKTQPKLMKRATAELLAERITEHASQHGLESISISLHGGEPLLAGHETVSASGQIEGVDTLKSSGAGSHVTSLNIRDHSFDDVLKTAAYRERCFPRKSLCSECKACPQREICVGGYLPHRYASKTGFANPSVYCTDLLTLIERIETDIVTGKEENGVLSRTA